MDRDKLAEKVIFLTPDYPKYIDAYNEERYGHTKDTCESQEYDAIKELSEKIKGEKDD